MPKRLTYAEGDFSGSGAPRVVDMVLAHLEGLSVMLLIALLAAGRAGWPGRIGSALGLLALAGGIWVFCRLPDLPFLPPEKIADGATASIPPAKTEGLDPAKAALVERGRYLFTVASCALCHGNDGAGGSKVSWRAMGTAWAANLTPDEETGLARWSDAEIERAIRSGITREGRQMHWQAMPWDHFSNFDEEDLRALVAWLRTLPPLKRAIPAPQPPSQEDCPIYTFFPGQAPRPRCQ